MIKKNINKKKGAEKAVKTKKEKLHKEVEKKIKDIHVKKISYYELEEKTISAKQEWYDNHPSRQDRWDYDKDAWQADTNTVKRWMVNYIRHNLTSYDSELLSIAKKVGCHEEYAYYKNAVLDCIAQTYPELEEECNYQKISI